MFSGPTFAIAQREFLEIVRAPYVIVLEIVYVTFNLMYGWITYVWYLDALHNVNIYGTVILDIPTAPPNYVLLGGLALFLSLGPLFVISTAFGSLSYEKSTKTITLLLSYPVSRSRIIIGKVMGLTAVITPIVATLPVLIIVASLASTGNLPSQLVPNLVFLEILAILYLLLWLALTILVSVVAATPGDSLAIAGTIWLALQSGVLPTSVGAFIRGFILHGETQAQIITDPRYFATNAFVGNLIPPYRFVNAIFGSYLPTGLPSTSNQYATIYILNTSTTFFQWLSASSGDFIVLAICPAILLLVSFFIFSKFDLRG